jgi:hypothetical protein
LRPPKTSCVLTSLTFFPQLSYGSGMRTIALPVQSASPGLLRSHALPHLEILALRQQLAMVNQTPRKRLRFHWRQRLFWVWLYRLWPGCLETLQVFKPDTLVHWYRKSFRLYWTWRARCRRGGRPPIPPEVRTCRNAVERQRRLGERHGFTASYKCPASTSPKRSFAGTVWIGALDGFCCRGSGSSKTIPACRPPAPWMYL